MAEHVCQLTSVDHRHDRRCTKVPQGLPGSFWNGCCSADPLLLPIYPTRYCMSHDMFLRHIAIKYQ